MMSLPTKKFLQSGYYYVRATWPFALGEVLAEAMQPMVKRLVILIMLLGSFRYLNRHAEPDMTNVEALNLLWPVFLSVIGVMLLPLAVAYFGKRSTRGRKRKTTPVVKRGFCRILFDSDEVVSSWNDYYEGQKAVMVYGFFILIVSPAFLYYSWQMFIPYIAVTLLFGVICSRKISLSTEHKFGRVFNRFADSDVYLDTIRYAAFCFYIAICAVIIVISPQHLPLEFIFVVIVGMRLQLARGKAVGKFFLQEAENGTVFQDPDEKPVKAKITSVEK
jgi:hypothetical protein